MAITTYGQLQTAITSWMMDRGDLATFTPDFITLAENWLNYGSDTSAALRCREMEAIVTLVPTNGVCTLPTDYIEYVRVAETTSTRRPLRYITADMADVLYPSRAGGQGCAFSITGQNLYTFPLASTDIELVYYRAIPALSDANPSNWLLTKAPGVYLRSALLQAAEFVKDDGEASKQAEIARALIAGLNRSDMLGKYARAGVTMRGARP